MNWRNLIVLAHISTLSLLGGTAAEAQSAQRAKNSVRNNLPRTANEFYIDARGRKVRRPVSDSLSYPGAAPYICTPSGFGTKSRCYLRGQRR